MYEFFDEDVLSRFKRPLMQSNALVKDTGPFTPSREIFMEMVLTPSSSGYPFTLIPSTFAAGVENKFYITVYSETRLDARTTDNDVLRCIPSTVPSKP
jgi:hypothetical protein